MTNDSEYTPYIPDEEIAEILLENEQRFSRVGTYDRLFSELHCDDKVYRSSIHEGFRICSIDFIDTFIGKHFRYVNHERSTETIEQRQCKNIHCGQLFYPRKREHVYQQYCSVPCSPRKGRKRILPSFRICEYLECGKEFKPLWRGHKYCTYLCSNRQTSKQRSRPIVCKKKFEQRVLEGESLGRLCPVCQTEIRVKEFKGRARYKIYCSKQCKIYVRNKKHYNKCQNVKMEKSC